MHKVVASEEVRRSRRVSIAFFHNLNADARVECIPTCCSEDNPAKYPPITAHEHLLQKFYAANASRAAKST